MSVRYDDAAHQMWHLNSQERYQLRQQLRGMCKYCPRKPRKGKKTCVRCYEAAKVAQKRYAASLIRPPSNRSKYA